VQVLLLLFPFSILLRLSSKTCNRTARHKGALVVALKLQWHICESI